MKEIYPIDSQGFVMWDSERYRFEKDDYSPLSDEIDIPIPKNIVWFQPRWDGQGWIEGGEMPELSAPIPPEPILK